MRAIDYLRQIKVLDDQINRNIREIERWRDMAYKITADPSEEHYNPNRPTSAPFEKCFEKADELERIVTADIDRLADLKFEAEEKISRLDDYVCRDILRLRYIEYRPWTEIISFVNLCRSQVFKKHNQALSSLDEIL